MTGPLVVFGFLATVIISGIENAVLVGGLAALGAALYSIGAPKDSVIQYETDIKGDSFLVMVRGPEEEVARAKAILAATNPSRLDIHRNADKVTRLPPLAGGSRGAMAVVQTDGEKLDLSRNISGRRVRLCANERKPGAGDHRRRSRHLSQRRRRSAAPSRLRRGKRGGMNLRTLRGTLALQHCRGAGGARRQRICAASRPRRNEG